MIVCSFRLIQEQDSKIDESRLKIVQIEASQLVKSCILCHLLIKQVFVHLNYKRSRHIWIYISGWSLFLST